MADPRSDSLHAIKKAYDAYLTSRQATIRQRKEFLKAMHAAIELRVTQAEIGEVVHLSRQRISQLLKEDL